MQLKRIKLYSSAIFLLGSSIATAGNMGLEYPATSFGEYSFAAGYFNATQGKNQHINITGLIGNNYIPSKKTDGNYLLGLGYLIHGWDFYNFNVDYGIKGFYLAKTDVRGVVVQEDLFANLSYHYSQTHVPIYALVSGLIKTSEKCGLTLDVGIGPNIFTTKNYYERSLDGGITIPDNAFRGRTNAAFSGTAGVGIRLNNLISSASVDLGYRFFYLGQSDLHSRSAQIIGRLDTNNCYANAVVLTVSI